MKRRLVLTMVMVSALLVTGLAGCGKSGDGPKANVTSNSVDNASAEGEVAPALKRERVEYADGDYYDYTYDEDGTLIRSVSSYGGDVSATEVEKHGNTVKYVYTNNGQVTEVDTYTYSDDGIDIIEFKSQYPNGNPEDNYSYTNEYDKNRNLVKSVYTKSGKVTEIQEYGYTDDGIQTMSLDTYYDPLTGEVISKTYYTYDSNYNELHTEYEDVDEPDWGYCFDYEYEYDEKGNVTLKKSYDNGQLTETDTTEYEYDSNDNITYQKVTRDYGWSVQVEITKNTWDGENILEAFSYYEEEGGKVLSYWTKYEYDSEGRMIHVCDYRDFDESLFYETVYTYYEDGSYEYENTNYNEDGTKGDVYRDKSDKNGNTIESYAEYDGKPVTYVYERNKYGHCTKCTENGELYYTGQFEYYE